MLNASVRSITDEYRLQATWLASSHAATSNFVPTNCSRSHCVERRQDDPRTLTFNHMKRCSTAKTTTNNDANDKRFPTLSLQSSEPCMKSVDKTYPDQDSISTLAFPVCQQCGLPLQPGWKGTNVVKISCVHLQRGSSKTRVRRVRRRRLAAKLRAQKDSSILPPRAPPKNRLIVQCGLCTFRNSLPGNPKPKKFKHMRKDSDQKGKRQSSKVIKGRASVESTKHNSTGTAQFVRLPEDSSRNLPSVSKPATTLAAAAGKKKKIKKTNLMDFLSSLND